MREDILARGEDPADFPILNSQPELFPDLLWIWEGFMFLTSSRQFGMASPQPILISEIVAYCELMGINDPDEREEFLHHVQKMDLVFQADFRARNPSSSSSSRGGVPPHLGSRR
jgi:hypothetical protein